MITMKEAKFRKAVTICTSMYSANLAGIKQEAHEAARGNRGTIAIPYMSNTNRELTIIIQQYQPGFKR